MQFLKVMLWQRKEECVCEPGSGKLGLAALGLTVVVCLGGWGKVWDTLSA